MYGSGGARMVNPRLVRDARRDLGRRLAVLRRAQGHTQVSFGQLVCQGRSSIAMAETGRQSMNHAFWARCDTALGTAGALARQYLQIDALVTDVRQCVSPAVTETSPTTVTESGSTIRQAVAVGDGVHGLAQVERLRRSVSDLVASTSTPPASLDDWEQTVLRHGRATRDHPADRMLAEVAADVAEVYRLMELRQSVTSMRRLVRVAAQLAGLMSLTLLKVKQNGAARAWARTARLAAVEAGDPAVLAWVLAQDAYAMFYDGQLREANNIAEQAITVAGAVGGVASALASAVAARAYAIHGDHDAVYSAMARTERTLDRLAPQDLESSAFGYNEAHLRFHHGNALTHLGLGREAIALQDRALDLYPDGDYLDRALVRLDRAACHIHLGDLDTAMDQTVSTLLSLTAAERGGLVVARARQVVASVPPAHRRLPAVRDAVQAIRSAEEEHAP